MDITIQSPFPGMNPYLESPEIWPDLYTSLMVVCAELLTRQIAPHYFTDLKPRIVMETDREDPSLRYPIRLRTLRICQCKSENLVTVIELLSPIQKRRGEQRSAYLRKRASYLKLPINLVEIDLLRNGKRLPFDRKIPPCDYLIRVNNASRCPVCDLWTSTIRQPLPPIPIPLLPSDPPALLDLGKALRMIYRRARYDLRIDYTKPASPPLSAEDQVWVQRLLAQVN